jgi:hypothetical protein
MVGKQKWIAFYTKSRHEKKVAEALTKRNFEVLLDGALKGAFGQVTSKNPSRFTILLETIGQVIRVDIDPMLLKRV